MRHVLYVSRRDCDICIVNFYVLFVKEYQVCGRHATGKMPIALLKKMYEMFSMCMWISLSFLDCNLFFIFLSVK